MERNKKLTKDGARWGGSRTGSGRKSLWPHGTTLKTMRLPASLEDAIKQFAQDRLNGPLEKISKPKKVSRRRPPTAKNISVETAEYFIAIHKDTDEMLGFTLGRSMEESIGKAQEHYGKWWEDIEPEGWEIFPIAIVLPSWRR